MKLASESDWLGRNGHRKDTKGTSKNGTGTDRKPLNIGRNGDSIGASPVLEVPKENSFVSLCVFCGPRSSH